MFICGLLNTLLLAPTSIQLLARTNKWNREGVTRGKRVLLRNSQGDKVITALDTAFLALMRRQFDTDLRRCVWIWDSRARSLWRSLVRPTARTRASIGAI